MFRKRYLLLGREKPAFYIKMIQSEITYEIIGCDMIGDSPIQPDAIEEWNRGDLVARLLLIPSMQFSSHNLRRGLLTST